MTKQEQLEKKVADTKAAADAAYAAYVTAYDDEAAAAYGDDDYVDAADAYLKAMDELENYIKEQVNE